MDTDLARQTVAADLSGIFGSPSARSGAPPAANAVARASRVPRLTVVRGLAALALAGAAGLLLGWMQARQTGEPEPSVTRLALAPPAAQLAPTASPALPIPPSADPGARARTEPAPIVTARPPVKPAALQTAHRATPPTGMARCSRVAPDARRWCAHDVVMAQDRSLRRAYAQAVRAGVSRDVLAGYSRRWARLRRDAQANPGRVAGGYAQMAQELTHRAQSRRHGR